MTQVFSDNYSPEVLMEMVEGFERWKSKTGHREFLLSALKEAQEEGKIPQIACILDAAVGVGYDAIYLAKNRFVVYGNDIDKNALDIARKNARKSRVDLRLSPHNWLGLRGTEKYRDAVLCVGNSLTYLFDEKDRADSLDNFIGIIEDQGILIIDERNYQYMFDHAREIQRGKFKYPGIYALSKDDAHLTPIAIKEGEVRFKAESKKTGHTLDIKFYPFKRNELFGLLRETGFRKIEQFSDYVPGFNPNADFYQYICTK
jgi:SAM-dependent methyltransferase